MTASVPWSDVLPIADQAFCIWAGAPEQHWAKAAWAHLTQAGLAANDSSLDRARACIRFLVLASVYRDWCSLVWDEHEDDELGYWFTEANVNPIHVGQLLGCDETVSEDPEEALEESLGILVHRARGPVIAALLTGFDQVEGLFLSLWRSRKRPEDDHIALDEHNDPGDKFERQETDAQILNDVTGAKLAAYAWIADGCPSRGPNRTSGGY
jgi:hypothetical protein